VKFFSEIGGELTFEKKMQRNSGIAANCGCLKTKPQPVRTPPKKEQMCTRMALLSISFLRLGGGSPLGTYLCMIYMIGICIMNIMDVRVYIYKCIVNYIYIYINVLLTKYDMHVMFMQMCHPSWGTFYGVATMSRLLTIIGLFCRI